MTKKITFLLILTVLGIAGYSGWRWLSRPIHYHSGFVVFENGKKIDFSDNKYMYIKPCSVDGKEDTDSEDQQMEKAHLHDNIGDVVHIESRGAKWGDLFTNIKFEIDYSSASAYLNGLEITGIKDTAIRPYDSLAVFVGGVDKDLLTQGITKERIVLIENSGGECSK